MQTTLEIKWEGKHKWRWMSFYSKKLSVMGNQEAQDNISLNNKSKVYLNCKLLLSTTMDKMSYKRVKHL